jgi:hypothetical protein
MDTAASLVPTSWRRNQKTAKSPPPGEGGGTSAQRARLNDTVTVSTNGWATPFRRSGS